MPDYKNGKVYLIKSKKTNLVYVGSTTQRLSSRMTNHRGAFRKYMTNSKAQYDSSFQILKHGDAVVELHTSVDCMCRDELLKSRVQTIRSMSNCVNDMPYTPIERKLVEPVPNPELDRLMKQKQKFKKQKYNCGCGSILTRQSQYTHEGSLKHKRFIASQ